MSLLKGMNERVRNMKIWDIKLVQGAAMCVMLIIAKLFPQILEISIWWLVVLAILLGIRPMCLFLHK
jgi:small neutral amino acid transporter SnatA (MarC family)